MTSLAVHQNSRQLKKQPDQRTERRTRSSSARTLQRVALDIARTQNLKMAVPYGGAILSFPPEARKQRELATRTGNFKMAVP